MPQVSFKTIESVDVSGKRVLVRVDLNVPMKNGQVTDATRIERAVPTLAELAAKGAKVIVLSHFGRPDGKHVPEMSLRPLVEPLSKALGKPVAFAEDCIGPLAEDAVRVLKPGDVLLLENLRFHKEEEKNDAAFIDKLSVLGDVYVNDAFSAADGLTAMISPPVMNTTPSPFTGDGIVVVAPLCFHTSLPSFASYAVAPPSA